MTQQYEFAVAGFPSGPFDGAIAGGVDRRAAGRCPVDAGVHLRIAEDRVTPHAEGRAHDTVGDWLAYQEFLRALAGLVIVIDEAVVGRLEAIELLGLAAGR